MAACDSENRLLSLSPSWPIGRSSPSLACFTAQIPPVSSPLVAATLLDDSVPRGPELSSNQVVSLVSLPAPVEQLAGFDLLLTLHDTR